MFDIQRYFDDKGISYRDHGKNIGRDWIGIEECPFCGDRSHHLGIKEQGFSCWVCGTKGSVYQLIKHLEEGGSDPLRSIFKKYHSRVLSDSRSPEKSTHKSFCDMKNITSCSEEILNPHKRFLESRNFNPAKITEEYKIFFTGLTGDWKMRVIIPTYHRNKIISFVGRDVTNKARLRYKNCPLDEAVIPAKEWLYNLNNARDTAIVVEGILDVWRIGAGAVALLGKEYTASQLKLLTTFQQVFILLDSDASGVANRLADDLSPYVAQVEVLELFDGDPADLSPDEAKSLRRYVWGKV